MTQPPPTEPPDPSLEPHEPDPVAQDINWHDFRDHLSTAAKDGTRRWLYPKKPHGRYYRRRTWVSWALLTIMFIGPFIRINGNPLLMMNIVDRKFSVLGQMFWPQDTIIFAVAMLLFVVSIIIFTAAFGRLWCGWTCPQTLLMEMVFRKIEYAIEGDAPAQRALDAAPWSTRKILKKGAKHLIFLTLSFIIGNTLLSYIIGSTQLIRIITDNPLNHLHGLGFMTGFTLIFYAIFARFREQACTFICPYGRFQSAMLDENSMAVAYDYKRGEKRAPLHHGQPPEDREKQGLGDCINCHQCVQVCPTGIDIRDGTQMECVNCTACIDACDDIMDRIKRPRGLIRYASLNSIEKGGRLRFTPRMAGYLVIVTALAGILAIMTFTRAGLEATLLRAPGSLFQKTADGSINNLYTLKIINKTSHDLPVHLRLEGTDGILQVLGTTNLTATAGAVTQTSVLIELSPVFLQGRNADLKVGIYSGTQRLQTIKTKFVGPRYGSRQ